METFSQKIDKISENIIYLLSIDSKISISDLAKKMNINRRIVENRYNHLFKEHYIKYLTVSNEKTKVRFTIYIKLSKIYPELIKKIREIPQLIKLKEMLGSYDLSLLVEMDSQNKADKIISRISNMLRNNILKFDVIRHEFEDTLGYKSFCHKNEFLSGYKLLMTNRISLTKDQETVLKHIKERPNFSYSDLRKEIKMSYRKLKDIINFLVSNNIIRFSIDPDYDMLGLEFHNILLKIIISKKKEFESYLVKHPRIHWFKRSIGRWDYVLSITAKNIAELVDIVREIREENIKYFSKCDQQ